MAFDPYYKWLGIPPDEQPPNYYRLLGLRLFESDLEVIDAAANRQMAYVQQCATGPHLVASQKLLNELSAARLCLLTPRTRVEYDEMLRATLHSPLQVKFASGGWLSWMNARRPVAATVVICLGASIALFADRWSPWRAARTGRSTVADWPGKGAKPAVLTTFLADLGPTRIQVFTNGQWGFGGKGYIGGTDLTRISVGGVEAAHGLGAHPPSNGESQIEYRLRGKYESLSGKVAIDDRVDALKTPLTFHVFGDGHELWCSHEITLTNRRGEFSVPMAGVDRLTLVVTCAGEHHNAHAVWVDPLLTH